MTQAEYPPQAQNVQAVEDGQPLDEREEHILNDAVNAYLSESAADPMAEAGQPSATAEAPAAADEDATDEQQPTDREAFASASRFASAFSGFRRANEEVEANGGHVPDAAPIPDDYQPNAEMNRPLNADELRRVAAARKEVQAELGKVVRAWGGPDAKGANLIAEDIAAMDVHTKAFDARANEAREQELQRVIDAEKQKIAARKKADEAHAQHVYQMSQIAQDRGLNRKNLGRAA
ncbi:MAG TPA: hypothetical protein VMB52_06375 [Verrucomicrobiae bacterium]|nr:hypothetical protein [Verrucomicrobiae bacterium]